jgi:hypothetical protein
MEIGSMIGGIGFPEYSGLREIGFTAEGFEWITGSASSGDITILVCGVPMHLVVFCLLSGDSVHKNRNL